MRNQEVFIAIARKSHVDVCGQRVASSGVRAGCWDQMLRPSHFCGGLRRPAWVTREEPFARWWRFQERGASHAV